MARMLVLAAEDQCQPIITYIDSTGGSAADLMGVISTMNGIRCPIVTFCRGRVAGPAIVIAAHGLKGFRTAAPDVRFSFKEFDLTPKGRQVPGQRSLLTLLAEVVAQDTRKPVAEVEAWFMNGAEFSAQEALRAGLIDQISPGPVLPKVA